MALPPSRLVDGLAVPKNAGPNVAVVRAHGVADDAVRVLIVLGTHLAKLLHTDASVCTNPRVPWRDRLDRLNELLLDARKLGTPYAALVDIDALVEGSESDADDPTAARMRRDLVGSLAREIERGGWLLVRPSPGTRLTETLDLATLDPDPSPTDLGSLDFLKPDALPLAHWLIEHERCLDEHDLTEILESVPQPSEYLASLVYDRLGDDARQTARDVHVLRLPTSCNGTYGLFGFDDGSNGAPRVDRASIEQLIRVGLLHQGDGRSAPRFQMSRPVRNLLHYHSVALERDRQRRLHHWLAGELEHATEPDRAIEAHHHAVRSHDIELAKRTARYHALDLRALATNLSREQHDYRAAADLFAFCLDELDASDAYCWEYLGYNLARLDREERQRGRNASRILDAYRRASSLSRDNPLYHGRWLGYRAEQGEDISSEFDVGMARYVREGGLESASVSLFAQAVLNGLKRGRGTQQASKVASRWTKVLAEFAPRVAERYASE